MRRVQRTAQIAATPAEVYAFLAEPANLPRWQAGMVSAERTSPPPTVVLSTLVEISVSHSFSRSKSRLITTASPKIVDGSRDATAPASVIRFDGTVTLI